MLFGFCFQLIPAHGSCNECRLSVNNIGAPRGAAPRRVAAAAAAAAAAEQSSRMRWLLLQQVLLPLAGPAPAAVRGVLPAANFSRVPVSSWCGNQSGPLSVSVAQTFATRPLVVFEKDMAQSSPPVGACEELKISAAAAQVRDASAVLRPDGPATQVLMCAIRSMWLFSSRFLRSQAICVCG